MLDKISTIISNTLQRLIAVIIAILFAVNLIQVIARYVANHAFVWVNDVTIVGLLWMVSFACPWLWLIRRHLQMDFADAFIPRSVMRVVELVVGVAAIVMGGMLTVSAVEAFKVNTGFVASVIGFDESFRYVPFIICGILWVVCGLLDLAKRLRDFRKE